MRFRTFHHYVVHLNHFRENQIGKSSAKFTIISRCDFPSLVVIYDILRYFDKFKIAVKSSLKSETNLNHNIPIISLKTETSMYEVPTMKVDFLFQVLFILYSSHILF